MKRFIAAFSYLFHPLFIPVYTTIFYFLITRTFFYNNEIFIVFLEVFILTVLLPISLYYLLRSLGRLKSKMFLDNKERRMPLALYALLLLVLIRYSFEAFMVTELYFYFTGLLISTLAALFFSLLGHKASLHMMGIASLTVFVISISMYYHIHFINLIAFLILCCGLTASSRLQLKAHSMGELALGLLIAVLAQVGLWYYWLLPSM